MKDVVFAVRPLQVASRFLVPRPHNFSENAFFVSILTSYARTLASLARRGDSSLVNGRLFLKRCS